MMDAKDVQSMMKRHAGIHPEELTGDVLREAGCLRTVAVLPSEFNERASYLANLLVQMLSRTPEDDRLRMVLGTLTQTLCYTLNSTSWREGELLDFDLDEIRRKLSRLKG